MFGLKLAVLTALLTTQAYAVDVSAFAGWVPSREGPDGPEQLYQQQNGLISRSSTYPTKGDIDRALLRVKADTSYFWTGLVAPCTDHNRDGIIGRAESTAGRYKGATLEMRLRAGGVAMPPWNGDDAAKELWRYASATFAENTSGVAFIVLGDYNCIRPGNTLYTIEIPRMKKLGQVQCIIAFTPGTNFLIPEVNWAQDPSTGYCEQRRQAMQVAIACLDYDAGGWTRYKNSVAAFAAFSQRNSAIAWRYGGLYNRSPDRDEYLFMSGLDLSGNPSQGTGYMSDKIRHDAAFGALFDSDGSRVPSKLRIPGISGDGNYNEICPFSLNGIRHQKRTLSGTDMRILPLGDSITWGYKSSDGNGYRQYLKDLLAGNNVDYVGSQSSGNMADPQNEGHPGYEIDQIASFIDQDASMKPNVVLLMAGTNDINNNDNADAAPDRLYNMLDKLVKALPDAAIIVAQITAIADGNAQARQHDFNGRLIEVAMEFYDAGKKVWPISMNLVQSNSLVDGLHPTDGGINSWLMSGSKPGSGSNKVFCPNPPNWLPQGQIATGGGLGRNGGLTNCQEQQGRKDPSNCQCDAYNNSPAGSPAVVPKPPSGKCSDLNDNSTAVHFADLNGDGRDDYLWVDSKGQVTAYLNVDGAPDHGPNAGRVQWVPQGVIASGVGANRSQIRFADLNGDGRVEYIYVHDDSSVEAWLNLGSSSGGADAGKINWLPQGSIASGIGKDGAGVRFADINGDGRAEYLWVDKSSGSIEAYVNAGGPDNGPNAAKITWIPNGVIASGVAPRSQVYFADLNGDGRADYLVIDPSTGSIDEWMNAGNAPDNGPNAAKVVWYPKNRIASGVGTNGLGITFGDLNGDGRAEYLDVNPQSSAVNAWLNGC